MELDFIRDYAMYAAIFGFFGMIWFGWAQENPPKSWRLPLGVMAGVCFLIACTGGYLAFKHWGDTSVFNTSGVAQQFGIIAGVEFASALIGVGILYWLRKQEFISSWIAFIVGLHFWPLAWIFQDKAFYALAVLVVLASVASIFIAKRTDLTVATLTGVGTGGVLLIFAIRGLIMVIG